MYSHQLNSSTHSHIIARKDPITGDSVKENDRVVFCAACKSCFLEDSWKYMNEQHCGQSQTLENVPPLPSGFTAKKGTNQLITELLSKEMNYEFIMIASVIPFLISFFILSALEHNFEIEMNFSLTLLIGFLGGILAVALNSIPQFRFIIGNHEDDIRIFKNHIELGKSSFPIKEVKQIKYQREADVQRVDNEEIYTSIAPSVLVYFSDGSFVKQSLPTKDYKQTNEFLRGLEKISYFKEVFFYSEYNNEYEIMQRIQSNSNGHIVLGEPARLFNS